MNKTSVKIYLCTTIIGSGIIYQLPYIRNIFYIPMIQSYGLSHYQMGMLSSVYAAISLVSYFFGGVLVTRYSWKKLLAASFILTGLTGFLMSFGTNYKQLLLGFTVLGVTTVLPYFSPIMCVNNILFSVPENSRFQIFLNAGRGITSAFLGLLCCLYFVLLGGRLFGMRAVILTYSVVSVLFGLLLFIILPEFSQERHMVKPLSFFRFNQVVPIIKKPLFFRWCLLIAASYSIYVFLGSYIPFLVIRYRLSVESSLFLGILRYVCSSAGVIFAVFLRRRVTDKKLIFLFGYIIGAVCMLCLMILPANYSMIPQVIIILVTAAIWVYACREFYYSLYSASEFTDGQYGLTIGLIAFISYIPEIFIQPFMGYFIDRDQFETIFAVCIIICLVGILSCCNRAHSKDRTKP